jgi:hypothetical protein
MKNVFMWEICKKGKVKFTLGQAMKAQTGVEIYLYCSFNLGARWGWVVNAKPHLLYPWERDLVPIVIGGWVGPRAGLDRCRKSRHHRDLISRPFSL